MKRFLAILLIIALFAIAAGCSTTNPSGATNPTQKPGDTATEPATEEPAAVPDTEEPTEEPAPAGTAYEVSYTNAIVFKDSINTIWVHVVVQIENTGSDALYLSSSTIDLEDANEHLVKTLDLVSAYPQVLLPGETALLVDDTTLDEDPGAETLTVLPHVQAKKATIECIRFETSEEELFTDQYFGVKLKGRVKNTSEETQSMVYVIANLYDADHHGIGQLMDILTNDLTAGDKVGFELGALTMPDSITEESIASFEVYAFPVQYQFDW